jgi:hypothetical protein
MPILTALKAGDGAGQRINLSCWPNSSGHMPDFIIDIFEPCMISIIDLLHPRMPSLAIAALTIAKCLFIVDLCGPSAIPPIIVVIFDKCASEHIIILADAGLNARITAATMAAEIAAYFILCTSEKWDNCQFRQGASIHGCRAGCLI